MNRPRKLVAANVDVTSLFIGMKISQMRSFRNLSVENLSQLTGISTKFLLCFEKGNREISVSQLNKIACALAVSPTAFYEDIPDFASPLHQRNAEMRELLAAVSSIKNHWIVRNLYRLCQEISTVSPSFKNHAGRT